MAEDAESILKQVKRENKTCFLCNERGPTYVDVDHSIFVCTFCSGLLREFSFKIKSTSLSTFSVEDVKQLRSFSNADARQFWLGKFRGALPRAGETELLRQFIRTTFVDNRWLGGDSSTSSSSSSFEFAPSPPPPPPQPTKPRVGAQQQQKTAPTTKYNDVDDSDDDFGDFAFGAQKPAPPPAAAVAADFDDDFDEFVAGPAQQQRERHQPSLKSNPFSVALRTTTTLLQPRPGKNLFDGFH